MADLMLIVNDLKATAMDVGPADFVPLLLWFSWILLFVIACGGVDFRDQVTQWCYMATVLAGGCILLIALPESLTGARSHVENMVLGIIFVLVGYVWWIYRNSVASRDAGPKKVMKSK